jgi:glutamate 5-kinase
MKDILVVKIGSSTLTAGTERISRGKIEDLARQIVELRKNYHIVLVSSGAVAAARRYVQINNGGNIIASKQALAAIGQPKLMQIYYEVFSDYNIPMAQCLLTYRDFVTDEAKNNIINTIIELLKYDFIPIINENDTVAVDEIIFGDNDKLSAKVAILIQAKTLILASDIDGLYTKNPHLYADAELITEISNFEVAKQYVEEKQNGIGSGGMNSKLEAAKLCLENNVETIITNGANNNFIIDALNNNVASTKFVL